LGSTQILDFKVLKHVDWRDTESRVTLPGVGVCALCQLLNNTAFKSMQCYKKAIVPIALFSASFCIIILLLVQLCFSLEADLFRKLSFSFWGAF